MMNQVYTYDSLNLFIYKKGGLDESSPYIRRIKALQENRWD